MKFARRDFLTFSISSSIALLGSKALKAADFEPQLIKVFSATINVGAPIEQGVIDGKRKRFIPIIGGNFSGERLNGQVLNGGGDWQIIHPNGLTEINARYNLLTHDGVNIAITNPGVRVASPEIIAKLAAGEDVDPNQYYFRTSPIFEVAAGRYDFLRRRVFVGKGIRRPNHVELIVYEVT